MPIKNLCQSLCIHVLCVLGEKKKQDFFIQSKIDEILANRYDSKPAN